MANLVGAGAALLSFAALVLATIAIASNYWLKLSLGPDAPVDTLNPTTLDDTFSDLTITYKLQHIGLWVGCHREISFDKRSCAYIGSSCYTNVCWVRNGVDDACNNFRLLPVSNCSAYQAARAMTVIGTIFLILGSSILVVSVCVASQTLSTTGAVLTFLSSIFLMIGFAVFYDNTYKHLNEIASIGWSFVLIIVAWPLAFVASVIGVLASLRSEKEEVFEESG
ncbi:unnamed protein product [Agarophyton chilense]